MTGPDAPVSPAREAAPPDGHRQGPFRSILFSARSEVRALPQPDCFEDLNLDQVVAAICAGREQYNLAPLFHAPLSEEADVLYRHEVMGDVERPDVLAALRRFASAIASMRAHLEQARRLRHPIQRQMWFLDAADIYNQAIRDLAEGLDVAAPTSHGFRSLRAHLDAYVDSVPFTTLEQHGTRLRAALAAVRYALTIHGAKVSVGLFEGQADYSGEIERMFARFKQGAVASYLFDLREAPEMNHVEEQVLERVARLHRETFEDLAGFCRRHARFVDPAIERFDREIQFYLGYLDLIEPLRAAGLSFCHPRLSAPASRSVEDAFDIALAAVLVSQNSEVVCNDFRMSGPERIIVVSGPNNGGKTTFARMFGQLHYLASLGLPVPARSAELPLSDRVFSHFERDEQPESLRGRLEDELVRVRAILGEATADSVIVMNESFSSTTLEDALRAGAEVMRRILERGAACVYVTFLEELASIGEATVSMVSTVVPQDATQRTFKIVRRPADGLAYAWAIAEKYGLSYERLLARITP
jgi:DNA mismatch repair protein MutS